MPGHGGAAAAPSRPEAVRAGRPGDKERQHQQADHCPREGVRAPRFQQGAADHARAAIAPFHATTFIDKATSAPLPAVSASAVCNSVAAPPKDKPQTAMPR